MPLTSMTGFADLDGAAEDVAWTWEARSVNGRGLDLRLRLPEGFDALEVPLRAAAAAALARGSVTLALRVGAGAADGQPRLNHAGLAAAIGAALAAGAAAAGRGLDLAPMRVSDLLKLRGVFETQGQTPAGDPGLLAALAAEAEAVVAALRDARRREGAALKRVLHARIDGIEALAAAARAAAAARGPRQAETLRRRVEAVLATGVAVDEARLAQELALIVVKTDVTEELDRLGAHVAAARALLEGEGPVGRKLDFLTQEFNREANTLCAKAQSAELTAIGLDMKVVIDQLREQVQNVE